MALPVSKNSWTGLILALARDHITMLATLQSDNLPKVQNVLHLRLTYMHPVEYVHVAYERIVLPPSASWHVVIQSALP